MTPVLQALVLAERVYRTADGKHVIAGTFSRWQRKFHKTEIIEQPDGTKQALIFGGTDPGCPCLYMSFTDVVNGTEITLQFVRQAQNEVLFQTGVILPSNSRFDTVEVVNHLPQLDPFLQEPGMYSFDVLCEGELIGSHRLAFEIAAPNVEEQNGN